MFVYIYEEVWVGATGKQILVEAIRLKNFYYQSQKLFYAKPKIHNLTY